MKFDANFFRNQNEYLFIHIYYLPFLVSPLLLPGTEIRNLCWGRMPQGSELIGEGGGQNKKIQNI